MRLGFQTQNTVREMGYVLFPLTNFHHMLILTTEIKHRWRTTQIVDMIKFCAFHNIDKVFPIKF